jgi:hypothetical protein
MPSAVVEAAFRARLEANWNIANGVIIGSNEQFVTPSDGAPFLLIQFPVAQNTRPMLTRRRFEEGAARIILNAPTGGGLQDWLVKADTIAAAFRGDKLKIGSSSNVEVFEPSPPIVNDDNEDGNYFELAVVIPYRYQFDWSANSPP